MKFDWSEYIGKLVNITLKEYYGMVYDAKNESPLYEIVFKTGTLTGVYDDGYLLETTRENKQVRIFVPAESVKCMEIFYV